MKEKEKSLELAKLMGWTDTKSIHEMLRHDVWVVWGGRHNRLCMYEANNDGLAQFAAILLKFPEVFEYAEGGGYLKPTEHGGCDMAPTQENILDEILRMNGVKL